MKTRLVEVVLCLGLAACGGGDDTGADGGGATPDAGSGPDGGGGSLSQTLYVAHEGSLVSYDVATGDERPGAVQDVTGPVDIQALDDGTIMVNLTGRNEVLAVDGATMLEIARIPSSGGAATRPVHSYITPTRGGKTYWMVLNDGDGTLASNSAAFIDITPGSNTRFERVGEVALGVGHHKASFSTTTARVVISNIGDCDNVLSVYDYADPSDIQLVGTFTSEDAGWTAADPGDGFDPRFCDPTYAHGLPPAPHGCATSAESGKAYCNLTSSGEIVIVDIDETPPQFVLLPTSGSGGGKTHVHPDGRYVYSVQEAPRGECQIGQLVVVDAVTDELAKELPLFYDGPGCTEDLGGSPAESANPDRLNFAHDGETLYIGVGGGFGVDDAVVARLVVVDTRDPADPVQLESITTAETTGHSSQAVSGDGAYVFDVGNASGSITQIATDDRTVERTITVEDTPKTICTYGSAEGPSEQTGPID